MLLCHFSMLLCHVFLNAPLPPRNTSLPLHNASLPPLHWFHCASSNLLLAPSLNCSAGSIWSNVDVTFPCCCSPLTQNANTPVLVRGWLHKMLTDWLSPPQLYSMVIATIGYMYIWKYPANHCTGLRATIGWTSPPFGWTALTSPDIASDIRTLTRPFLSGQNDFTFYIEKRLQCAMCMVTARISISVYLYQLCMNQLEDTRSLLNERWFVRILSRAPAGCDAWYRFGQLWAAAVDTKRPPKMGQPSPNLSLIDIIRG